MPARARALAESLGRVMVVDHVMRYNPLLRAIQAVQHHLGLKPIRFLFENDAADESLPRDHWFWDESVSGGIFVEHGVHFFDAATMFVTEPATVGERHGHLADRLAVSRPRHGDGDTRRLPGHAHALVHPRPSLRAPADADRLRQR